VLLPWVQPVAGGGYDGLSIRLWEAVSQRMGVRYNIVNFDNDDELLKAVHAGHIDVAISPISITAQRCAEVTFTQPYMQRGIGIMSWAESASTLQGLRRFFSDTLLYILGGLALVLALVGLLVWLVERGHDRNEVHDISDGAWLALVTLAGVGYGDVVPRTRGGRLIMAVFMLVAMLSASALTAAITTALTSHLSDTYEEPRHLSGRRVAALSASQGATFAHQYRAQVLPVGTLDEAIDLLLRRRVDAVVANELALEYFVSTHRQQKLSLVTSPQGIDNFGYAVPHGSPWLNQLNVSLLALAETGEITQIEDAWLQSGQTPEAEAKR
jgi:polar amino acid transport system substrate-binding protein